jgi:CubicO group peptidase (beta-lactamase class C family)
MSNAAFDVLARDNTAASMTVMRDGVIVLARASGTTIDGAPATSDSPMVVASVSKIVVAFTIARLQQEGSIDVDAPVPWDIMGILPHPGWLDVTVRELLDHTSGMPVVRTSWFDGSGDCSSFLPSLVDSTPQGHRGGWKYSNGNYCALGLLIEHVAGEPLDAATQRLVFNPLGIDGVHLTVGGLLAGDLPHAKNVDRLSRLGGAGTFVISTDDLAAMLATTTPDDYATLATPGVIVDQYGWGHTGTVSEAKSCVWVLEFGRTVVATTIAGNSPDKGGTICDRVVPALAVDLGIGSGERPTRTPPYG